MKKRMIKPAVPNCVSLYIDENDSIQTVSENLKAGYIVFEVLPLGRIQNDRPGFRLDIYSATSKAPNIFEMYPRHKNGAPTETIYLPAGRFELRLAFYPENDTSLKWLDAGSIEVS